MSCNTLACIRGLTVACGDQRRRTGSGSALQALRDDALCKYTFTVLYFTSYLDNVAADPDVGAPIMCKPAGR